ncbi:hypothetical protein [Leifsonia sp. fls2-241-R2A-40a]|nr:hypothetical protein [Leifsonia sp. fls2-241-R2A-40a]
MSTSPRPSTVPALRAVLARVGVAAFATVMAGAAVVAVLFGVHP